MQRFLSYRGNRDQTEKKNKKKIREVAENKKPEFASAGSSNIVGNIVDKKIVENL